MVSESVILKRFPTPLAGSLAGSARDVLATTALCDAARLGSRTPRVSKARASFPHVPARAKGFPGAELAAERPRKKSAGPQSWRILAHLGIFNCSKTQVARSARMNPAHGAVPTRPASVWELARDPAARKKFPRRAESFPRHAEKSLKVVSRDLVKGRHFTKSRERDEHTPAVFRTACLSLIHI